VGEKATDGGLVAPGPACNIQVWRCR